MTTQPTPRRYRSTGRLVYPKPGILAAAKHAQRLSYRDLRQAAADGGGSTSLETARRVITLDKPTDIVTARALAKALGVSVTEAFTDAFDQPVKEGDE